MAREGREQIAIVGIGCRFPGGINSPQSYWERLCDGVDATCEIPVDRWNADRYYHRDRNAPGKTYVRRGGFLQQAIDRFDAAFFGISPREAGPMDPQQRLLLEVSWEALEDAGLVPDELQGSNGGVFIGGFTMDNKVHLLNSLNREIIGTHTAISSTMVMLSNRLSYIYDLRGPSMTVDTACSSSLVAIHLACQALLNDECDLAIAGGVNVMLRPEYTIAMCKGSFLSVDGRCRAFDASGAGYGRGEGCGVLILKRLERAEKDHSRIHATIAATGVNQDGRTNGITLPNQESQKRLIEAVCEKAGVKPAKIGYAEAHGTGTLAGDVAEAQSLGEALGRSRPGGEPLWIGSAKTNLGHLEAAAGVAGVIKAALVLKNRKIPPNLHFKNPRPEIDWQKLRLRVPVGIEPLPGDSSDCHVAVNSFGYGGTNAHAILSGPPARTAPPQREPGATRAALFPVSAKSPEALVERLRQLENHLTTCSDQHQDLASFGYTASRRRTHFRHRVAVVATSRKELQAKMGELTTAKEHYSPTMNLPRRSLDHPNMAFVYTGMSPQNWGMGVELLDSEPCAEVLFEKCDEIWTPLAGWSLATLFSDTSRRPMSAPEHAQPANFVIQVLVTEVMRSYGVSPRSVVGHSVGEIAAAHAAGVLGLEEALTLTYHRSQLQQRAAGNGKMIAIGLSREEVAPLLNGDGHATIAAVNSAKSVTVAGDSDTVDRLAEACESSDVFFRVLRTDVAYHSRQMDPLESEFKQRLAGLSPHEPVTTLYSSVTGRRITGEEQTTDYWWRNARDTVQFSNAISSMAFEGVNIFVEIGPHPVLDTFIKENCRSLERGCETVAMLRRDQPEQGHLQGELARLYSLGIDFDWSKQFPAACLETLPSYPWQRELLWEETQGSRQDRLGRNTHPLVEVRVDEPFPVWDGELRAHAHSYLADHKVQGETIFPGAGYVELAILASESQGGSVIIKNLQFHKTLAPDHSPVIRAVLSPSDGVLSILSRPFGSTEEWVTHASAMLARDAFEPSSPRFDPGPICRRCREPLDLEGFYRAQAELGLEYGGQFQCIERAFLCADEILSNLATQATDTVDYFIHPTLLDAAFQSLLALQNDVNSEDKTAFLPVEIEEIRFHRKTGSSAICHAVITSRDSKSIVGRLTIYTERGDTALELSGFRAKAIRLTPKPSQLESRSLYQIAWDRKEIPPTVDPVGSEQWLVIADSHGVGSRFIEVADEYRLTCVEVGYGTQFRHHDDSRFQVRRGSSADLDEVISTTDARRWDGILFLWALDQPETLSEISPVDPGRAGMDDVVGLVQTIQALKPGDGEEELKVCIATVRAYAPDAKALVGAPGQHAVIGAARTLAAEFSNIRVKVVDLLDYRQPYIAGNRLMGEVLGDWSEAEVALRGNSRFVQRIDRVGRRPPNQTGFLDTQAFFELAPHATGEVDQANYVEKASVLPKSGELDVEVTACLLRRSSSAGEAENGAARTAGPGTEVYSAGIVRRTGKGVSQFASGAQVLVLARQDRILSHLVVHESTAVEWPSSISATETAYMVNWVIAYQAIENVGSLSSGQTVLVNEAAGGVGFAAIQLARAKGATVIATAGTDRQRDYLRQLGFDRVSDSRSLQMVDDIGHWTGDRGVDLILNASCGDQRVTCLKSLARDGCYLEVGRIGQIADGVIPFSLLTRNVKVGVIDLVRLQNEEPETVQNCVDSVLRLIGNDTVTCDEIRAFPASQVGAALRRLAEPDGVGGVVLALEDQGVLAESLPARFVTSDGTYLVSGGFGGLGLYTLEWLADMGAKSVIVLSRSGPTSDTAKGMLEKLASRGVEIHNCQADVADFDELSTALDHICPVRSQIRGVIHGAGIVDDSAFELVSPESIERVMRPKAIGALNLDSYLQDCELDFFICYSSVASLLGNAGQIAYAAANGFVDGLMNHRKSRGLPGLTVNWGAIAGVGMAAADPRVEEHLRRLGIGSLDPVEAMGVLERLLRESTSQIGVADIDWSRWSGRASEGSMNRMSRLTGGGSAGSDCQFPAKLLATLPENRAQLVFVTIAEQVSSVMRVPVSRIEPSSNLTDFGLDSLMTLELTEAIHVATGVDIPPLHIAREPVISGLVEKVTEKIPISAGCL